LVDLRSTPRFAAAEHRSQGDAEHSSAATHHVDVGSTIRSPWMCRRSLTEKRAPKRRSRLSRLFNCRRSSSRRTPAAAAALPITFPSPTGPTSGWPLASHRDGRRGAYATKICSKTPCDHVQAFLELPVNTVFPDGCTLPLATSAGPPGGFATSGGTVDWLITDGTCTAHPSGKPIDDPNIPAYTTEYVEQRINTVGGGTFDNSPVVTTTTTVPWRRRSEMAAGGTVYGRSAGSMAGRGSPAGCAHTTSCR
jgi:hypothetical protein